MQRRSPVKRGASHGLSRAFVTWAGHPIAFASGTAIVVGWAVRGPRFGYSKTLHVVIRAGTTIVTFLMVFRIQNSKKRDGAAIQGKLDELIRASAARNRHIGIEPLTGGNSTPFA